MSKNKRMIYIWEENVEFYDGLANKSDVINRALSSLRDTEQTAQEAERNKTAWEVDQNAENLPKLEGLDDPSHPDWHPDPRIRETRKRLAEMDARDAENVRRSRGGI